MNHVNFFIVHIFFLGAQRAFVLGTHIYLSLIALFVPFYKHQETESRLSFPYVESTYLEHLFAVGTIRVIIITCSFANAHVPTALLRLSIESKVQFALSHSERWYEVTGFSVLVREQSARNMINKFRYRKPTQQADASDKKTVHTENKKVPKCEDNAAVDKEGLDVLDKDAKIKLKVS